MIFSYNYFSKIEDIDYYYRNKPLFLLNIKFFNQNYQYLYNQIQYICFNSFTWLNINSLEGVYEVIDCWAVLIDTKKFILCGLFNNVYEAVISNTKIVFTRTNFCRDFLISQQLLQKL